MYCVLERSLRSSYCSSSGYSSVDEGSSVSSDDLLNGLVEVFISAGLVSAPFWLPIVAAKGIVLLAGHGIGLTVTALITAVEGLLEGKRPKVIAKEVVKTTAVGATIEGPLEDWLKDVCDRIKRS